MATLSELVCCVSTMRAAQKQYFKSRDKKDMYHAWNMERAVDQMLEQFFAPMQTSSPGSENEIPPSASAEPDNSEQGERQESPF